MNPNQQNTQAMPHSHKTLIAVLILCLILAVLFFAFFDPNKNPEVVDENKPSQPQSVKPLTEAEIQKINEAYSAIKVQPVSEKDKAEFSRLSKQNSPTKLTPEEIAEINRLNRAQTSQ